MTLGVGGCHYDTEVKNNSSAFANELFKCVWSFCGVGFKELTEFLKKYKW